MQVFVIASISQIAISHGIPPLLPLQSSFVFCELHSSLQRVDMTMKNDKAWIGDLPGGLLMSRESRIIAELMLTNPDEQTRQEQIVGHRPKYRDQSCRTCCPAFCFIGEIRSGTNGCARQHDTRWSDQPCSGFWRLAYNSPSTAARKRSFCRCLLR